MKKSHLRVKSLAAFILLFSTFSCIRRGNYDEVVIEPWEPALAVPVINSTLTLKDLAENIDKSEVNVIEKPNGLYVFIYQDTVYSNTAEELIQVPNQFFQNSLGLTPIESVSLASGTSIEKTFNESAVFTTSNNENLKSADLKGGSLALKFTSDFKQDAQILVTFNSVKKGGSPLIKTYDLKYTGQSSASITDNIDLSGYTVDLSGNNSTNTLTYDVRVKLTSNGNIVTGTESIKTDLSFTNLKYKTLRGNFGTYTFPAYEGEVTVQLFENAEQGEVVFNDPLLKMNIENSFGVPSAFTITKLETESDFGKKVSVTSTGDLKINAPTDLPYPTQEGTTASKLFTLDKSNSNIVDAFKIAPSTISYKIIPQIISSSDDNFIQDNSKISLFSENELPMDGSIKVYQLADTARNIELPDPEFVDLVVMKFKTTNTIPVDVNFQGVWLDSSGNQLGRPLIANGEKHLIVSGNIDANGNVTSAGAQYFEITYNAQEYAEIKNATMLRVEADLMSSKEGTIPVKFYSYNNLKLEMSIYIKGKIEF